MRMTPTVGRLLATGLAVLAVASACGGSTSATSSRPSGTSSFQVTAAATCRKTTVEPLPPGATAAQLRSWALDVRGPLRKRLSGLAAIAPPARLLGDDKLLLNALNQELILTGELAAGSRSAALATAARRFEREQRRYADALGLPACSAG